MLHEPSTPSSVISGLRLARFSSGRAPKEELDIVATDREPITFVHGVP